ncbi:MAG: hypothetical protein QW461_07960 [Candidatus Jordarchaeales archaeon]
MGLVLGLDEHWLQFVGACYGAEPRRGSRELTRLCKGLVLQLLVLEVVAGGGLHWMGRSCADWPSVVVE